MSDSSTPTTTTETSTTIANNTSPETESPPIEEQTDLFQQQKKILDEVLEKFEERIQLLETKNKTLEELKECATVVKPSLPPPKAPLPNQPVKDLARQKKRLDKELAKFEKKIKMQEARSKQYEGLKTYSMLLKEDPKQDKTNL